MVSQAKVSIIVPVYNAEKYLKECLDSLVNQTLSDIEIICINDGSKDTSPQILEEYSKNDSRIKIINQKNQGVSIARNNGIKEAKGEYLVFLDSDDFFELTTLEELYNYAKNRDSDLLLFSFYLFSKNELSKDERLSNLEKLTENKNTTFQDSYEYIFNSPMGICSKFYKTDLIKENKLLFPLNIQCGEDRPFYIEACVHAKNISVLNKPFYYYRRDVSDSLTQGNSRSVSDMYTINQMIKKIIYKCKNRKQMHCALLDEYVRSVLWGWRISENKSDRIKDIKYLNKMKRECSEFKKYPNFPIETYKRLVSTIDEYNNLFVKKLLEPIFEFERKTRYNKIAFYLFEKQIFNIDINKAQRKKIDFIYQMTLLKLRLKAKFKKIKVAFLISDVSKWTCQSFFDELKNSKHFEPVIYNTVFEDKASKIDLLDFYKTGIDYFKKHSIKYEELYNIEEKKYIPIKNHKADIIFYQQPWGNPSVQGIPESMKFALTAYIPYCFYSMDSIYNYLDFFHGKVWKYFVETSYHKEKYEKEYSGHNCYVSGSVKLDNYRLIDREKILKEKGNKKRIIYAPHHSLKEGIDHVMGTFGENGKFILELAKQHPETEWIFRPHPVLADRLLQYNMMTQEEIDKYYQEWAEIGTISTSSDNYYEQFVSSDCLITDCISFLSEYLPSGNPVIHLRRKEQLYPFNDLLKKITETYYQSHNNDELGNYFEEVVIKGNDYLKEQRQEALKLLIFEENQNAGYNIRKYLEHELRIR